MRKKEYDSIIDGKLVPFSAHGDASDDNANKGRRVKEVRAFIGFSPRLRKSLDIGPPNAFGRALGILDNTTGDLNHGVNAPSKDYELILFSEIIEHLGNPLMALEECRDLLVKGGILIVSTPLCLWHSGISYQSPHHLTEYRADRFRRLLEFAGFEIVKYKRINIWDRGFFFRGIRPALRVLFHRSQLWMARKP